MKQVYLPSFYQLDRPDSRKAFQDLLHQNAAIEIVDTISVQLRELLRITFPAETISPQALDERLESYLQDLVRDYGSLERYGVWVYYPWLGKVVHTLYEDDFVRVRTSRNSYKIKPEEITLLRKKKIGVLGLSVGQSVALTMAMERICGEIRLADFDAVELSNLNRLKCGISDLGLNKTILAARQIVEMDPFIKVICYPEGGTLTNLDDFFLIGGKLDLFVEECDGIDMKILSRVKARVYQVPVVMDTNDKGMLDIERFDLEPQRPLLHGRLEKLEALEPEEIASKLQNLTMPEKIAYLAAMIGMENVSEAMKESLPEMNKTIVGWPQLASAVTLGGAMVTDVSRRILLGQLKQSGRYFVEFEELINDSDKNFRRA